MTIAAARASVTAQWTTEARTVVAGTLVDSAGSAPLEPGAVMLIDGERNMRVRAPRPQMVLFGAIDFSAAPAPMAAALGYAVTTCDARETFIRSPRFARSAGVVRQWPDRSLATRTLGPRDAVLALTHDPKFDEPALLAAVNTDAGYIGALGGRRPVEDRNERLRRAGPGPGRVIAAVRSAMVYKRSRRARPALASHSCAGAERADRVR
ncbi:XdhC family protein [Pseudonocardia bannensis]|uniref:XdhC/CoxF family protein n=1 Tax=Pseudonocardia bannensis TaxID=630973 RepID=A0A848DHK3_9PSEU|nr:XdhC family protein [Pseudonocardia bannensis]NMH92023.1 XdhC/CoxF family protein [Pseudonocardia bannensis]